MVTAGVFFNGIACVCNVAAAADVVRVENIQTDSFARLFNFCNTRVGLRGEKGRALLL